MSVNGGGGGHGTANFRSTSTSTKFVNGKKTVTKKYVVFCVCFLFRLCMWVTFKSSQLIINLCELVFAFFIFDVNLHYE